MEVASGEGEDDDGDPAIALAGAKQHRSCSCPMDLFTVSIHSSPSVSSQDCPASSSEHFGHHLYCVEDILREHQGDGHHGNCIGVNDRVSLLLLDLWVSFTDHQSVFRASSQPHGHSGRQTADHEGGLGPQDGVGSSSQGAACSMVVWGWVVNIGDGLLLDTLGAFFIDGQPVFRASFQPYGHLGRQVVVCEGDLVGRQGGAVPGQSVGWGKAWVGARG